MISPQLKAYVMNRFLSGDSPEVETGARETPTRSAPAVVYALLTNSSSCPFELEDWLGEIVKALGARLAALVALLDNEPFVQYFFPKRTAPMGSVNWPWEEDRQSFHESRKGTPAVPTQSADGRSSFLTVAVQHEGFLWVLCMEDAINRRWSVDEQAALTLAALGLFQFASLQESSQKWANWSETAQTRQRLENAAVVVRRLAHDFNNVLTSVLGFTELSLTQLLPGSAQRNLMAEVYAAALQGSQLINQLSLFSTRKTMPQSSTTSLAILLADEENRLRKAWGDAIALEMLVPPDLPALWIDADSLRIILDKLLENAREAISTTGTVILSARQVQLTKDDCLGLLGKTCPGQYVEIMVGDSGRGFSAEARRRVLAEPFFSTKPRHRGLGLAAVYGVLINCGGGIRLEHGLETSTRVRVYLPSSRRAAEAVSPERPGARRACHLNRDAPSPRPLPLSEERVG